MSITLSGKSIEPGLILGTSAALMPRVTRNMHISPTTFEDGVTLTMSPKSSLTSA